MMRARLAAAFLAIVPLGTSLNAMEPIDGGLQEPDLLPPPYAVVPIALTRGMALTRGSHDTLEDAVLQPPNTQAILHLEVPYGSRVTIHKLSNDSGEVIRTTGRSRHRHVLLSPGPMNQSYRIHVELDDEVGAAVTPKAWSREVQIGPNERRHIAVLAPSGGRKRLSRLFSLNLDVFQVLRTCSCVERIFLLLPRVRLLESLASPPNSDSPPPPPSELPAPSEDGGGFSS